MGNFPGDTKQESYISGKFEIFWEGVPEIPAFRDDFYLHTVLLKQRLLELSTPVWRACLQVAGQLFCQRNYRTGSYYAAIYAGWRV